MTPVLVVQGPCRGWLAPVAAQFVSAFAMGTSEFIIAGLLPAIASSPWVDIPTAGLLISGYTPVRWRRGSHMTPAAANGSDGEHGLADGRLRCLPNRCR